MRSRMETYKVKWEPALQAYVVTCKEHPQIMVINKSKGEAIEQMDRYVDGIK